MLLTWLLRDRHTDSPLSPIQPPEIRLLYQIYQIKVSATVLTCLVILSQNFEECIRKCKHPLKILSIYCLHTNMSSILHFDMIPREYKGD